MEESFGVIPIRKTEKGWEVFLVCLKNGHHWSFPKGHKKDQETPLEAAMRELKEETSLEVESFLQTTPFFDEYVYEKKGMKIQKKVFYFPAVVKNEVHLQEEEILEGRWVTFSQAKALLTYPSSRKILSAFIQKQKF
jgi:bis(5'-nucleosidyl)-tetraphosphatase